MPNFLWPGRRDVPMIGDTSLAALLAGTELPPGAVSELRPLAEALAELRARPASDELEGEAETLAAFRNHLGPPHTAHRPPAGKPSGSNPGGIGGQHYPETYQYDVACFQQSQHQ